MPPLRLPKTIFVPFINFYNVYDVYNDNSLIGLIINNLKSFLVILSFYANIYSNKGTKNAKVFPLPVED